MAMRFAFSSSKPTQNSVHVWTPWGVVHCSRDSDEPEAELKPYAAKWLPPAMVRLSAQKPDQTPQR